MLNCVQLIAECRSFLLWWGLGTCSIIVGCYLVDLSKNKLSEFPAELCDFVMIEKVDLYHNTIRGVPESQLSELKFLRVLNLRWVAE